MEERCAQNKSKTCIQWPLTELWSKGLIVPVCFFLYALNLARTYSQALRKCQWNNWIKIRDSTQSLGVSSINAMLCRTVTVCHKIYFAFGVRKHGSSQVVVSAICLKNMYIKGRIERPKISPEENAGRVRAHCRLAGCTHHMHTPTHAP